MTKYFLVSVDDTFIGGTKDIKEYLAPSFTGTRGPLVSMSIFNPFVEEVDIEALVLAAKILLITEDETGEEIRCATAREKDWLRKFVEENE